ncbi:MAG: alpha/beta fold hydrolase [candidate division Zixibacteria bacterium]|nr:alpha/beta fold hydrolase [candidate division Zixibacteria bacterium]
MRTLLAISIIFLSAFFTQNINSSQYNEGFDSRLTGYEYPYKTDTLKIYSQKQRLEMVYMDVSPANHNGRNVLLLHGKNFSGAYWASTIEFLTGEGYRVIAPDQIGFGKSSKPEYYQFSFHILAENTRKLLESLDIEKTAVVGHSMGGMLSTRFALMFPEMVEKLVLVNPIGLEDWKRKAPYLTIDQWYQGELRKSPEMIKAYMKENYFDGVWKDAYDPLLEIQAGWTRGADYQRIAWVSALTYDMIFTQPVLYEFGDLQMPVLLIIGQRDRTALGKNSVSPEVAQTLGNYPELGRKTREAIPNAELVELDNIGHVPQYEAPRRYIESLKDFLK